MVMKKAEEAAHSMLSKQKQQVMVVGIAEDVGHSGRESKSGRSWWRIKRRRGRSWWRRKQRRQAVVEEKEK